MRKNKITTTAAANKLYEQERIEGVEVVEKQNQNYLAKSNELFVNVIVSRTTTPCIYYGALIFVRV